MAARKLGIASGCSGVKGRFGKAGVSILLSIRAVNSWHGNVHDTSYGLIDPRNFCVAQVQRFDTVQSTPARAQSGSAGGSATEVSNHRMARVPLVDSLQHCVP